MSSELYDLEKVINSGLTAGVKSSGVKFNQLTIEVKIEEIVQTIIFLKTNDKTRFKQYERYAIL